MTNRLTLLMAAVGILSFTIFFLPILPAQTEEPSISKEDKDLVYKTVGSFSDCAGTYYAIGQILESQGSKDAAEAFQEQGNGTYLAGAWLLASLGIIKDWQEAMHYVQEPANSTKRLWMGRYELSLTDAQKLQLIKNISKTAEICISTWGEYQKKLITGLRKWMYETRAKDKDNTGTTKSSPPSPPQ